MQKKIKNTLQRKAWIKRANKRFHMSRWGCIAGLPKQWKGGRIGVKISYVASVPTFFCCELEREQKTGMKEDALGEDSKISSLPSPLPFFALPSTFINSSIGNAWKAVYRQSGREHHFFHYICQAAGYPSEIVIKVSKINWKNVKCSTATACRMKLGQGLNHYR